MRLFSNNLTVRKSLLCIWRNVTKKKKKSKARAYRGIDHYGTVLIFDLNISNIQVFNDHKKKKIEERLQTIHMHIRAHAKKEVNHMCIYNQTLMYAQKHASTRGRTHIRTRSHALSSTRFQRSGEKVFLPSLLVAVLAVRIFDTYCSFSQCSWPVNRRWVRG